MLGLLDLVPYLTAVACAGVVVVIYMRKTAKTKLRECGKDYPRDTVILHQYPRGPYAPSMSGFCIKLETFLRMANIPYQNVFSYKASPKSKIPWMEYNGEVMGDSQRIIEYLKQQLNLHLDEELTPEQRGMARAWQRTVDEHTYWTAVLERWVYNRKVTARTLTKLPGLMVWEIGRRIKNMTWAHGIGRHSPEEVAVILQEDLQAISDFLGDKQFMMGDKATSVDCAVFGQLSQIKWHVPEVVTGRQLLNDKYTNISAYLDRMKDTFWPDWDECITRGFTQEATK